MIYQEYRRTMQMKGRREVSIYIHLHRVRENEDKSGLKN